jgi:hypothetical protein
MMMTMTMAMDQDVVVDDNVVLLLIQILEVQRQNAVRGRLPQEHQTIMASLWNVPT